MTKYSVEYEIKEEFGEPIRMFAILCCPDGKTSSEMINDFLQGYLDKQFTLLSIRKVN